jgi:hypothetical protein
MTPNPGQDPDPHGFALVWFPGSLVTPVLIQNTVWNIMFMFGATEKKDFTVILCFRRLLAIASTCGEAVRRLWHSPSFTTSSKSFFILRAFNFLVSFFQLKILKSRNTFHYPTFAFQDVFLVNIRHLYHNFKKFLFIHIIFVLNFLFLFLWLSYYFVH